MKIVTIKYKNNEQIAIQRGDFLIPITEIDKFNKFPNTLREMLETELFDIFHRWFIQQDDKKLDMIKNKIPINEAEFTQLYQNPTQVFGIGLNYKEHAGDLDVATPDLHPVFFFKPTNTHIGFGEEIKIPKLSERTTGEAELAVIIKKDCRNVKKENWHNYVAGFTTVLDMTAEDILRKNTRYLGLSKVFDSFLSFGPQLITLDEIKDLPNLRVSTVVNGEVKGTNVISNMTFQPDYLVEFISSVMPLYAGDIISTGTPRASVLKHGDLLKCEIDGFISLENPVVDLKTTN